VPPSQRLGTPLPADLEAVILACLEKDPARRPESAAELSRRLAACADWRKWGPREAHTWWREHQDLLAGPRTAAAGPAAAPATIRVDLDARLGREGASE
jgi:hypothetical protein